MPVALPGKKKVKVDVEELKKSLNFFGGYKEKFKKAVEQSNRDREKAQRAKK